MKKSNRHKRKNIIWLYVLYLILAVGLVGDYYLLKHETEGKNKEKHVYKFIEVGVDHSEDPVQGSIVKAKEWIESDYTRSAQYDCVVTNNADYAIYDWTVYIGSHPGIKLTDFWSGECVMDEDYNIIFSPMEEIKVLTAGGDREAFGFIVNTTTGFNPIAMEMVGYQKYNLKENIWYWIIVLAGALLVIVVLVTIIMDRRERMYKKRLANERQILNQAIKTFVNFIDAKDAYTRGHSSRVATYSAEIARRMGKKKSEVDNIYYIGLMHDVGKIGVPDSILNKPGKLTEEEWKVIQTHTILAEAILEDFNAIPHMAEGAKYHHERFDGCGYPTGLAGKEIPETARIICIADAFDAMSTNRCYRDRLPKEVIIDEFRSCSGSQFDPDIVPYMIDYLNELL